MFNRILFILSIFLFSSTLVLASCGGSGKKETGAQDMHGKEMHNKGMMQSHDEHSGDHKMPGDKEASGHKMHHDSGEMSTLKNAEALYTCPMHPDVITADVSTPCPLCNMKLKKMSDEKVKELLSSNPRGCPMDPIVVKGDSKTENCPVCNMKLGAIKLSYHSDADFAAKPGGLSTPDCGCCES